MTDLEAREDALFRKALKFLYEMRLQELGYTADVIVTRKDEAEEKETAAS